MVLSPGKSCKPQLCLWSWTQELCTGRASSTQQKLSERIPDPFGYCCILHPGVPAERKIWLQIKAGWSMGTIAVDSFWLWSQFEVFYSHQCRDRDTCDLWLCRYLCQEPPDSYSTSLSMETQSHEDLDVKNVLVRGFHDSSAMERTLSALICQGIPQFHTATADKHCPLCSLPLILCSLNFN